VSFAKEQRLQRPKSPKKSAAHKGEDTENASASSDLRKPYSSGGKKCHTLKTQIAVRPDGSIVAVADSVPSGVTHALTLLRQSRLLALLDVGEAAMMDKGYNGITENYPDMPLYLPFKARRNHPLTDEQKAYNQFLSKYGIRLLA